MKCNNCNSIIPDDSIFCSKCGIKINEIKDIKCSNLRKVKIERAWHFTGAALMYQVMCDGKAIATLRNGETKEFEIDENSHSFQCYAFSPTIVYGNASSGIYGGGGTIISDLVIIPNGVKTVELLVKPSMMSIRLEIKE